jgi:hypothetical protein
MIRRNSFAPLALLVGLAVFAAVTTVVIARAADSGEGGIAGPTYDLTWHTIDGGGGTSSSVAPNYEVTGTIGQPDAGAAMTAPGYELVGGFWAAGGPLPECEGDADNSGTVDVDDLIAVVLAWGTCADCANCPPDVAPFPVGNCMVNVDDLIAVILNWGPC